MKSSALLKTLAVVIFLLAQPVSAGEWIWEDFETGSGGFITDNYAFVSEGSYYMIGNGTNTKQFTAWKGGNNPGESTPVLGNSNYFQDFHTQVNVIWHDGSKEWGYGLSVCNRGNQAGTIDYVRFMIDGAGGDGWYIIEAQQNGEFSTLVEWTPTQWIYSDSWNHLSISKSNDDLVFSINYIEVARQTIDGCIGGAVALEASNLLTARFDNFEITSFDASVNQQPIASFYPNPSSGAAPLTVFVDAGGHSSDLDGTIVDYTWNTSDGQSFTGKTANLVFNASGSYTITLTVTDDDGASAAYNETVTVEPAVVWDVNSAPHAAFTVTPDTGDAPLKAVMDAGDSSDSDGTIASYNWESSDGQAAAGKNATLIFDTAGSYTVTLTVKDDKGATASASQTITVTQPDISLQKPSAVLTATPLIGDVPLTVALEGGSSSDPDGSIVEYKWTASDGQQTFGVQSVMVFSEAGTYTIELVVTDNDGLQSDPGRQSVLVKSVSGSVSPNAVAEASPLSGGAPLNVTLDGTKSLDPDGGSITSYEWTSSAGQTVSGSKATLSFDTVGTYTVTLTVTDDEGETGTTDKTIIVSESSAPPVAVAQASPSSGDAPLEVILDGTGSSDPDGGSIVSYEWTASDGQTTFGSKAALSFNTAGEYSVTLKVTDDESETGEAVKKITVTEPGGGDPGNGGTDEFASLQFQGASDFYKVGEFMELDLAETVSVTRFQRLDLWVAIQLPSGDLFFKTSLPMIPFSTNPQAFKEGVENANVTHRILEFEVPPGMGGDYSFYALYVLEGKSPLTHGFTIQRSNLAFKTITLANQ
ncbi:MAG: PKD domain-containing protein [Gammaproteobacteria bacterium]|nr:PKD domain-containing protein [Gammaproteobacteria bacterium]